MELLMVHHKVALNMMLLEIVESVLEARIMQFEAVPWGHGWLLNETNGTQEVVSVIATQ